MTAALRVVSLRERACVANDEPAALPQRPRRRSFHRSAAPRGGARPSRRRRAQKLTLGYQRMQTLLKDWQKITGGSCGARSSPRRRRKWWRRAGGPVRRVAARHPEAIGYKSINDPLCRARSSWSARAALKNPDDLDACWRP